MRTRSGVRHCSQNHLFIPLNSSGLGSLSLSTSLCFSSDLGPCFSLFHWFTITSRDNQTLLSIQALYDLWIWAAFRTYCRFMAHSFVLLCFPCLSRLSFSSWKKWNHPCLGLSKASGSCVLFTFPNGVLSVKRCVTCETWLMQLWLHLTLSQVLPTTSSLPVPSLHSCPESWFLHSVP